MYEITIRHICPPPDRRGIEYLTKGASPEVELIYMQRVEKLELKAVISAVNHGGSPKLA